ncbi:MAG: tRNA (guanine-N1)-methyltransferase [candidate division Zixibacteria bacterium SM23_81]|nr:MAG: tRNA (guanine-N1)-methyltransferase [candidate division Zixibacteria bacterium SM23_81]
MRLDVLTIFPEMFKGFLSQSIIKRAQEKGLVEILLHDLRQYTSDKHGTVDDYPYGGGPGMILKPEPVFRAVESVQSQAPRGMVILLTPQGEQYHHRMAMSLSGEKRMLLICGRYKGLDERIRTLADREISIGDYVLTGGELPAMVIIDSVVRQVPGVLGDQESAWSDSFFGGILDAPQFTRPGVFRGLRVPEVLLSGDHGQIRIWRKKEALRRTLQRRPEILKIISLTEEDERLIAQIQEENRGSESAGG